MLRDAARWPRVMTVMEPCPPGQSTHVYRELGFTVVFFDPQSTRSRIVLELLDTLTLEEWVICREAWGVPNPAGREVPEHLLAEEESPVERRVPMALRAPGHVDLPYRRRLVDLLTAAS